jgi:hypothetical protein
MFGLDNLEILFVVSAFLFQIVLQGHHLGQEPLVFPVIGSQPFMPYPLRHGVFSVGLRCRAAHLLKVGHGYRLHPPGYPVLKERLCSA